MEITQAIGCAGDEGPVLRDGDDDHQHKTSDDSAASADHGGWLDIDLSSLLKGGYTRLRIFEQTKRK
jgi:hypothetical protein